jgi:hypothetical protein
MLTVECFRSWILDLQPPLLQQRCSCTLMPTLADVGLGATRYLNLHVQPNAGMIRCGSPTLLRYLILVSPGDADVALLGWTFWYLGTLDLDDPMWAKHDLASSAPLTSSSCRSSPLGTIWLSGAPSSIFMPRGENPNGSRHPYSSRLAEDSRGLERLLLPGLGLGRSWNSQIRVKLVGVPWPCTLGLVHGTWSNPRLSTGSS